MKKKAIMLKFLFYLVLALIFFVPTVLWATEFFNISTKAIDSFNSLAQTVGSVGDGEIYSTALYLDKGSVIVGFTKDSKRFENRVGGVGGFGGWNDKVWAVFDRPINCEDSKACICLCKDYELDTQKNPFLSKCDKPICRSFDNIDFISQTVLKKDGEHLESYWSGGFMYARDAPSDANNGVFDAQKIESGFTDTEVNNKNPTRTLYIQMRKNYVGICPNSSPDKPCLDDKLNQNVEYSG